MKTLTKLMLLVFLSLVGVSCSTDSIDDNADALSQKLIIPVAKPLEIEVLELINNHRLSLGLNPLKNMDVIKAQAYTHTEHMVIENQISHDNFFARSEYLKENAGARTVAENVAYGYTKAESVVNAWLKSDSHRKTIEGDYTNFDLSAEQDTDGNWYYTNIFIKK